MVRADLMNGWKSPGKILHRHLQALARLRQNAVVGKNRSRAAQSLPQRQELLLEFDPRNTPRSCWAHIHRRRRLEIRVTEFEGQLRNPLWPAALVVRAQTQDKVVFIKCEILRVVEKYLPHIALKSVLSLLHLHIKLLRRLSHDAPKIHECVRGGEMLRLQNNLILAILNLILRGVFDLVL